MSSAIFARLISRSPYQRSGPHWQLDDQGQLSGIIAQWRQRSDLTIPVSGHGATAPDDRYPDEGVQSPVPGASL